MITPPLAPICIFVYNRPEHTEKMLRSLMTNALFVESEVFVFADGPKENATEADIAKIREVRKLFEPFINKLNFTLRFSEKNKGLTSSIVSGITEIINHYGKIIVIEDDLELSPGFLKYMNDALNLYENEERVMHIGGYMVPNNTDIFSPIFFRAPTIWGWGTWKNRWQFTDFNAKSVIEKSKKINRSDFEYEFNVHDGYPYYRFLNEIAEEKINAWSIMWYAEIFMKNGLCLLPSKTLVRNIGFDDSGVNCEMNEIFTKAEIFDKITVLNVEIIESEECVALFKDFWKLQSIKVQKPKIKLRERIAVKLHRLLNL